MAKQTKNLRFKQMTTKLDLVGLYRTLHQIGENILFKAVFKKWNTYWIHKASLKKKNQWVLCRLYFLSSVKIEIKTKDDQNNFVYLEI